MGLDPTTSGLKGKLKIAVGILKNGSSRIRTYDLAVNSRSLYQLSYRTLVHGAGFEPARREAIGA